MKIVKQVLYITLLALLPGTQLIAQTPQTTGGDTSRTQTTTKKITDTGFLHNSIKQQIIDIRLAQLAATKASKPRVKEVARQIVADGRDNLRRMLSLTQGQNLPGLTQAEIDQAMGDVAQKDSTISASDPAAAATTGNTVTDSLGSGSSGSGNVSGEDTGTLAKTSSAKRNTSYSSEGDYAYNNNMFLNEAEVLNSAEGKGFDAKWVGLMLKIHQGKVEHYNKAVSQVKDPKLKVVITQVLPKLRMHAGALKRISEDKDISEGMDNQKGQDDKINSRTANE